MLPNKINLLLISVVLVACYSEGNPLPTSQKAKTILLGEYELHFNVKKKYIKQKDLSSSELILHEDGSCEQICKYQNGKIHTLKSKWQYFFENADNTANVCIDEFKDCAGAWPSTVTKTKMGACLVIEFSQSPIILVSSDLNVFYKKREQKK